MTILASFDGTRLALDLRGRADGSVVVLVHGLGLSMRSWGRVPELLADEHRVVSYDLRGHGGSTKAPTGDYGLFAHARDLGVVLAHALAEARLAVVVGHSLGGGIILAHAQQEPRHRMAGVVFAGSGGSAITLPGLPPSKPFRWAQRPLRHGWLEVLRLAARVTRRLRGAEPVADALVRRLAFGPDAPADLVRQVRDDFMSSRPEVLAETTRASGTHDGARLAPALRVPTLVLHGDHDPQVPDDELLTVMAALPDAERVEVPGAGHMLPLTHPDLVATQVARWTRRVIVPGESTAAPTSPGGSG
jgi:pimeloyl-ACP methyl ester carboxylesterase